MDKTPRKGNLVGMGPALSAPASQWLELAVAAAAQLTPQRLACHAGGVWALPQRRVREAEKSRYSQGEHAHHYAEVCIAVRGEAAIDIDGKRYHLIAPAAAVLEPHVKHSEAWKQHDKTYALVWLGGTGSTLIANVNTYRGHAQWEGRHLIADHCAEAKPLIERFASRDAVMQEDQFEPFRADLLAAVCAVFLRSRQMPSPTGGAASGLKRHRPVLEHIRALIDEDVASNLSVKELADIAVLSPNYLNTLFKAWTGCAIHEYRTRRRMETAMALCRAGDLLIKQVALHVGYDDPLYFSRAFHRHFGRWPSDVQSADG